MAMSERMQKELTKLCLAMRRANKAEEKAKQENPTDESGKEA